MHTFFTIPLWLAFVQLSGTIKSLNSTSYKLYIAFYAIVLHITLITRLSSDLPRCKRLAKALCPTFTCP